jgi:hypothetical protein
VEKIVRKGSFQQDQLLADVRQLVTNFVSTNNSAAAEAKSADEKT